jgi:ABC-2 type transport system ATP-binding protein
VIEVSELTKWYGSLLAVDRLSFTVHSGEVVGFLGPNGAGKSTTLRMLTGFLAPSSGRATVAGYDITTHPLEARQALGYLPETCPLYPELRVTEYLAFRAQLKHVPRRKQRQRVEQAMQLAGIYDRRGSLIGQLSKGLRQRVGLADAIVAEPPLLILDEPTAGLDPNQIREVRDLLRQLKEHHTVLLSTHILQEVEMVCDRAIVLAAGRVVGQGTLAELQSQQGQARAEVVFAASSADFNALPAELGSVATLETASQSAGLVHWSLTLKQPNVGLAPVLGYLVKHDLQVREARLSSTRLEDVFARLTRKKEPGDA